MNRFPVNSRSWRSVRRRDAEFPVLCYLPGRVMLPRVRAAAKQASRLNALQYSVERVTSWSRLESRLHEEIPRAVIIDPEGITASALALLVNRNPVVPFVAYVREGACQARCAWTMAKAGIFEIVLKDHEDEPFQFASLLMELPHRREPIGLDGDLPSFLHILCSNAVHNPQRSPVTSKFDVQSLTDLWMPGASRSSLAKAFRDAALPSPGWFIRWITVTRAVALHSHHGRDLVKASDEVGLPSYDALYRRCVRLTGCPPSRVTLSEMIAFLRNVCGETVVAKTVPAYESVRKTTS
jgi:AraC-like DNA-binding protein